MSTAIQEDISTDEFNDALYWDLGGITPGRARELLGMPLDAIFTNHREALRRLGHPKYQEDPLDQPELSLAEWAEFYASKGIPVFPLAPGTKNPLISKKDGGNGFHDATTDIEQVRGWWGKTPDANIGTPIPDDCMVFDVDGGKLETLGNIPKTATVRSGGKNHGWHKWFKLPDGITLKAKQNYPVLPGIDVLSHRHYMVLPPSVVESQYEWETPLGSSYNNVAPIPPHLLDILVAKQNHWLTEALSISAPGNRSDTGIWLACQLRDDRMTQDAAWELMQEYVGHVGKLAEPEYTEADARKSLEQAYNREAREPAHAQPGAVILDAGKSLALTLTSLDLTLTCPDFSSYKVEIMRLSEEADMTEAEHLDDRQCAPGTPHYIRRQAQWKVLRALWTVLAPGDTLNVPLMSKWLTKSEKIEPGLGCILVVDCLLAAYENHLQFKETTDIRHPRQYYNNAVMHQLDDDFGWKKAELKAKVKAAKQQEPVEGTVRVLEERAS